MTAPTTLGLLITMKSHLVSIVQCSGAGDEGERHPPVKNGSYSPSKSLLNIDLKKI